EYVGWFCVGPVQSVAVQLIEQLRVSLLFGRTEVQQSSLADVRARRSAPDVGDVLYRQRAVGAVDVVNLDTGYVCSIKILVTRILTIHDVWHLVPELVLDLLGELAVHTLVVNIAETTLPDQFGIVEPAFRTFIERRRLTGTGLGIGRSRAISKVGGIFRNR